MNLTKKCPYCSKKLRFPNDKFIKFNCPECHVILYVNNGNFVELDDKTSTSSIQLVRNNYGQVEYNDGLAIAIKTNPITEEKRIGFVDKDNNIIIPFIYPDCIENSWSNFENGYCSLVDDTRKYGLIDIEGRKRIPFIYDESIDATESKEGIYFVARQGKLKTLYYLSDYNSLYIHTSKIMDDLTKVTIEEEFNLTVMKKENHFFATKGDKIFMENFDNIECHFQYKNNLKTKGIISGDIGEKRFFYSFDGVLIGKGYDAYYYEYFDNGHRRALEEEKKSNKKIRNSDFVEVHCFIKENLIQISKNQKVGLIDLGGRVKLRPIYWDILSWNTNLDILKVVKNRNLLDRLVIEFINAEGKNIFEKKYFYKNEVDTVCEELNFSERIKIVPVRNSTLFGLSKIGFINQHGKVIIPFKYDEVLHFDGRYFEVEKNGEEHTISQDGKIID
jgi:hypothetical protein